MKKLTIDNSNSIQNQIDFEKIIYDIVSNKEN